MARSFKLHELRKKLRSMTATENDESFTTDELNGYLEEAACETVDTMIVSGLSEKTVKNVVFSTVAGTTEYDLQSTSYIPDGDFYKVSQIYVDEGSGQLRPLPKLKPVDIQTYRAPSAAVTVKLYYIPHATRFRDANDEWDDNATFDGVNGWEEHLLCGAAIRVKVKSEEDYRAFENRKAQIEQRMVFAGGTDFSGPDRVSRKRHRLNNTWHPYNNQLSAWNIRGDKLELYYAYPWVP